MNLLFIDDFPLARGLLYVGTCELRSLGLQLFARSGQVGSLPGTELNPTTFPTFLTFSFAPPRTAAHVL